MTLKGAFPNAKTLTNDKNCAQKRNFGQAIEKEESLKETEEIDSKEELPKKVFCAQLGKEASEINAHDILNRIPYSEQNTTENKVKAEQATFEEYKE